MLYLLWGLINIGLLIFFIVTCFLAAKMIREKIGMLAAVVFVFGLLSFAGHSNDNNDNREPNSNHVKTWKFASENSVSGNGTFSTDVDLERTLVSKFLLGITYGKGKDGELNIPLSAYSSKTGFVSGTNWKPLFISVQTTRDNKFEYFVNGVVEWKLLGATIYSQYKQYKGVVPKNKLPGKPERV